MLLLLLSTIVDIQMLIHCVQQAIGIDVDDRSIVISTGIVAAARMDGRRLMMRRLCWRQRWRSIVGLVLILYKTIDMVLSATVRRGHLEYVGYAEQRLLRFLVRDDLEKDE